MQKKTNQKERKYELEVKGTKRYMNQTADFQNFLQNY